MKKKELFSLMWSLLAGFAVALLALWFFFGSSPSGERTVSEEEGVGQVAECGAIRDSLLVDETRKIEDLLAGWDFPFPLQGVTVERIPRQMMGTCEVEHSGSGAEVGKIVLKVDAPLEEVEYLVPPVEGGLEGDAAGQRKHWEEIASGVGEELNIALEAGGKSSYEIYFASAEGYEFVGWHPGGLGEWVGQQGM